jgi:hypothetical protein
MILKFRKPILSKLFNPHTRKAFVVTKRRIKLIRQEAHALRQLNECDYLLDIELVEIEDVMWVDKADDKHRQVMARAIYV